MGDCQFVTFYLFIVSKTNKTMLTCTILLGDFIQKPVIITLDKMCVHLSAITTTTIYLFVVLSVCLSVWLPLLTSTCHYS